MTAGTYSTQARAILGTPHSARLEQHRAMAHEALQRAGYHPVETPDGMVRYEFEATRAPAPRSAFARVTLASGRVIAVNPRRVVQVHSEQTHGGAELTILVTTAGDALPCAGSVEDVVAQLEACAA